jgi:hypothetical protein
MVLKQFFRRLSLELLAVQSAFDAAGNTNIGCESTQEGLQGMGIDVSWKGNIGDIFKMTVNPQVPKITVPTSIYYLLDNNQLKIDCIENC